MTKEEILATKRLLIKDGIEWIPLNSALKAMEQYRNEGLKEELIKYDVWLYNKGKDSDAFLSEELVDEYFKQKP
jgi:hypothetical protein